MPAGRQLLPQIMAGRHKAHIYACQEDRKACKRIDKANTDLLKFHPVETPEYQLKQHAEHNNRDQRRQYLVTDTGV